MRLDHPSNAHHSLEVFIINHMNTRLQAVILYFSFGAFSIIVGLIAIHNGTDIVVNRDVRGPITVDQSFIVAVVCIAVGVYFAGVTVFL
jgi:hypothetical protein